jgi:hypothetical protein
MFRVYEFHENRRGEIFAFVLSVSEITFTRENRLGRSHRLYTISVKFGMRHKTVYEIMLLHTGFMSFVIIDVGMAVCFLWA